MVWLRGRSIFPNKNKSKASSSVSLAKVLLDCYTTVRSTALLHTVSTPAKDWSVLFAQRSKNLNLFECLKMRTVFCQSCLWRRLATLATWSQALGVAKFGWRWRWRKKKKNMGSHWLILLNWWCIFFSLPPPPPVLLGCGGKKFFDSHHPAQSQTGWHTSTAFLAYRYLISHISKKDLFVDCSVACLIRLFSPHGNPLTPQSFAIQWAKHCQMQHPWLQWFHHSSVDLQCPILWEKGSRVVPWWALDKAFHWEVGESSHQNSTLGLFQTLL